MVDYSKSRIYKIISQHEGDNGLVYFGSTTQELSRRMDGHRGRYILYKNGGSRLTSSCELFDKYGKENCIIVLVENCNFGSKEELLARERFYIENNNCVNKRLPILYDEERNITNKVYNAEYYETHGQQLREARLKYYYDNREEERDKQKKYREDNAEKLKEMKRQTFTCECGIIYTNTHKGRHQQSARHMKSVSDANPQK